MDYTSLLIGPSARAVDRAIGELRRGVAVVVLGDGGGRTIALPAETATQATLDEFLGCVAEDAFPVLLVAPSRAAADGLAARGGDLATVALDLRRGRLDVDSMRAMADPLRTVLDGLHAAAEPEAAHPARTLAKLARLLPAVLAAPAGATATAGLLEVSAADILAYGDETAEGLTPAAEARVPLAVARDARVIAFRPQDGGIEHLAVLIGRPEQAFADGKAPLVRVHSECFTGDLLGSLRCDCGPQLRLAMQRMAAEGEGVLLYMAQEGRGIGLVNKLRAYALQDGARQGGTGRGTPLDTLDANRALGYGADERSFAAAATMLRRLGITRVRLLTNNPEKVADLATHGIEVAGRVSHAIAANGINDAYLETKALRFGHLLGG